MDLLVADRHSGASASLLPSGWGGGSPSLFKNWDLCSTKKFLKQEEEHEGRKAELEEKQRATQTKALRQLLRDFEEQMERELYGHPMTGP